jgi:flagellar L-ring protein precursor FlgH
MIFNLQPMNTKRTFISLFIGATLLAFAPHTATAQQSSQQQSSTTPPAASADSQQTTLTTTASPGRHSWVSDRRDFHLGDIVTLLVDEYTLTSLDKQVNASDERKRDMDVGLSTPSSSQSFGFGSNNTSSSQNRGTDARTNRVTTEMSARVVEIAPNGLMRVEAKKQLDVEKSKINMTLSGWVRTQDVSPDNFVQSYRLADAKLDYQAEGPLGSPKGGILGRILGKLWP